MKFVVFLTMVTMMLPAYAELRIDITKGVDNPVRIAVVPMAWRGQGALPQHVASIVDSDLKMSGRFAPLPVKEMLSLPNVPKDIYYRDWRLLKVEYLVIGYLTPHDGKVRLHFGLYNIFKQSAVVQQTIQGTMSQLRDMAHYVSDVVYQKLTGIKGAFDTRIMYVTVSGPLSHRVFRLNIADADGRRPETILTSDDPIMSATWGPKGKRIAYVSFQRHDKPAIYMRNLVTNQVQMLTDFPGLNSAPAFSPNGKELALVLSRHGNVDIYVLNLKTRQLRRITRHYAIDTEPSFTPDGKSIIFTSDRGGTPQIYEIRLSDLSIQRLTFEGNYNAKASMLPDGSGIVLVHRTHGAYRIALMNLKRGTFTVLTKTALDESPSIAPNGSMIIYATQVGNRGILAAVSVDGGVEFRLPSTQGDVMDPAWSPVSRVTFTPISQ